MAHEKYLAAAEVAFYTWHSKFGDHGARLPTTSIGGGFGDFRHLLTLAPFLLKMAHETHLAAAAGSFYRWHMKFQDHGTKLPTTSIGGGFGDYRYPLIKTSYLL